MVEDITARADERREKSHEAAMKSWDDLGKATAHLNKETERGKHSPKIAGHDTRQHGGQIQNKSRAHPDKDLWSAPRNGPSPSFQED